MSTAAFGLGVLVTALAGVVAVLSSRVSERLRIPAPAFFLIAAAAVADLWPRLFSVLGRREVAGRGGALLEGESGSNDPVSIALLAALLAASGAARCRGCCAG